MDLSGRTLLGKYRIEALLGQGGMGQVWKGVHVVTGRKVAIKVLDERFLSNVNVVQRFGREARAASAVQHDGIVEVLDLDQTEEGLPFLVMEFLEGETLSKRIERKGKLSQEEAARIGTLLLEALAAAHEHGVVHRDLKPDNIFLVPAGRRGELVKILDFGISHKDDEAQAKLTMTGSVLGTPHYMSPEQAMGETTLDRRVDIYGVGVVLYECVVGDVPYDAPNYNKLLRVILDEDPVAPTQRGAMIEPRFERVILSAIEKDRDRRPQTARDLLAQLKAATTDETERFGPEMVARLAAAGARSDADRKRTASASFAKPKEGAAISSTSLPVQRAPGSSSGALPAQRGPAPATTPVPSASSGVRGRGGLASEPRMAAVGDDLRGLGAGSLDAPDLASRPVPRADAAAPARAPALRLDAAGKSGSFGALDDVDPLSGGGGPSLELDESALARPSKVPEPAPPPAGASSISGRHRAVAAAPAPVRNTPPRSTPAQGSRPAVRPAPEEPAAPAPRTLRDRWDELPEPVRRWGPIVLAGVLVFVVVVAIVRSVVRPHADGPEGAGVVDPVASGPADDPARPEFVVIEVDGVPPGATLRLDGLPGATLPLRLRRGSSHVLVIQAPGYQERRIPFAADANTHLRADLRPAIGTGQQL